MLMPLLQLLRMRIFTLSSSLNFLRSQGFFFLLAECACFLGSGRGIQWRAMCFLLLQSLFWQIYLYTSGHCNNNNPLYHDPAYSNETPCFGGEQLRASW